MKTVLQMVLALTASAFATGYAQNPPATPDSAFRDTKWTKGPALVSMANNAQLNLPKGYVFTDANDTNRLMEALHNPTSGQECGFVAPERFNWFAVYGYDETGYIKDDEKNSLDADKLLSSIQQATEKSNELRRKHGWSSMTVTGWQTPPRYNPATHNLEWAINGESDGQKLLITKQGYSDGAA